MPIAHQTSWKFVAGSIVVMTILLGTTLLQNKKDADAPSEDVQQLDAKLLADLQNQEIAIDNQSACIMECAQIRESELRSLLDIAHLNYGACETGNCHYTSYTIEGKTEGGKQVQFKIDSGEEGNLLRALKVENVHCACL